MSLVKSKARSVLQYAYNLFTFLDGIIQGNFSAAFAGGWRILFIVVHNAKMAFIDHFVIAFYISGTT